MRHVCQMYRAAQSGADCAVKAFAAVLDQSGQMKHNVVINAMPFVQFSPMTPTPSKYARKCSGVHGLRASSVAALLVLRTARAPSIEIINKFSVSTLFTWLILVTPITSRRFHDFVSSCFCVRIASQYLALYPRTGDRVLPKPPAMHSILVGIGLCRFERNNSRCGRRHLKSRARNMAGMASQLEDLLLT